MLDTIYTDFTTKLLPKIQEGLVITKDYFLDLFGRYVTYLIITDTIIALSCLITVILALYLGLRKSTRQWIKDGGSYSTRDIIYMPIAIVVVLGTLGFFNSTFNVVKDIYIPEIRVIEKIQAFRQE